MAAKHGHWEDARDELAWHDPETLYWMTNHELLEGNVKLLYCHQSCFPSAFKMWS